MHKINDTTDRADMSAEPPFGPGFTAGDLVWAVRMEVLASGINDPGADFCEFRLYNEAGQVIATRRVDGY